MDKNLFSPKFSYLAQKVLILQKQEHGAKIIQKKILV